LLTHELAQIATISLPGICSTPQANCPAEPPLRGGHLLCRDLAKVVLVALVPRSQVKIAANNI